MKTLSFGALQRLRLVTTPGEIKCFYAGRGLVDGYVQLCINDNRSTDTITMENGDVAVLWCGVSIIAATARSNCFPLANNELELVAHSGKRIRWSYWLEPPTLWQRLTFAWAHLRVG